MTEHQSLIGQLLDIVSGWNGFWQGLFVFYFVMLVFGGLKDLLDFVRIILRGYPTDGTTTIHREGSEHESS